MKLRTMTCALALSAAFTATAADHVMTVKTGKLGAPVQSTMYGIFF